MPEQFGFKEKTMHALSELSPVDKALQERAEWLLAETGIEKHLKEGGQYLDVGTGKGHVVQKVLEDMEKAGQPLKGYYGIEVADKPLKKVQKRELERQGKYSDAGNKNPMNFVWASGEALPFTGKSLDGVSFIFSVHHMDKDKINTVFDEAKRVLKDDGKIFVVEDLVDSDQQRDITETRDRQLNWEGSNIEHAYKSDREWQEYFDSIGLEIVEKKFFKSQSKKGPIPHGFYIVRLKQQKQ